MPAAVSRYAETKSYLAAQREQDDILVSLKEDFGKYRTRLDPAIIRRTLTLVAEQCCRKFTYTDAQGGIAYRQSKTAVELLERAKLVLRSCCTHATGIPLGGDINPKSNKFLLLDTGLYLRECGLDASDWISDPPEMFVNRGVLAEMHTGLELKKSGSPLQDNQLFYWHRESRGSSAEVDFVLQFGSRIVPLEVKSGKSHNAASYKALMHERNFEIGIKTSVENLAVSDGTHIIPMYLVGDYDMLLRSR